MTHPRAGLPLTIGAAKASYKDIDESAYLSSSDSHKLSATG
jgi:hypothetical protein